MSKKINSREEKLIAQCRQVLEKPSLAIRIADKLGKPLEWLLNGVGEISPSVAKKIATVTRKALMSTLSMAIKTFPGTPARGNVHAEVRGKVRHKLFVSATGAAGGALGLAGLAVELPASTTIMMRSIADIARQLGHDITRPNIQLECLQVFALGSSRSTADDAAENTYFSTRIALARTLSEAAEYIAVRGLGAREAPVLVRFIAAVASRFEISVSEKAVAQALPAVGAVTAATINLVFLNHFQKMADAHFRILALEAKHGRAAVRRVYNRLGDEHRAR